ncbi:MAG: helix-turn-helix transcriptional regulator [Candidatus Obscuribacter sp.]|nr:helix-turn-helix transcriptional regulator [Candidatus Obscuribacter sp.]
MQNLTTDTDQSCPIVPLLDLMSAKWTVQILRELALGPVRTRRFLRVIPGLSMKTLQERIKALQSAGMISRKVYDEKLPHVEHTITERGRRLFVIMSEIKEMAAETSAVSCKCPLQGCSEADTDCPERRVPPPLRTRLDRSSEAATNHP